MGHIMGDHFRFGQSSMLHGFQKNVRILNSRFMARTVEFVHTQKIILLDQLYLFQSLKMYGSSNPDIRQLVIFCEGNPCVLNSTLFGVIKCPDRRRKVFGSFSNQGTCHQHAARSKCFETGA